MSLLDSHHRCALCVDDGGTPFVEAWCLVFVTLNHAELVNWQTHSERGAVALFFCSHFPSCLMSGQTMGKIRNTLQTSETLFYGNTKIDDLSISGSSQPWFFLSQELKPRMITASETATKSNLFIKLFSHTQCHRRHHPHHVSSPLAHVFKLHTFALLHFQEKKMNMFPTDCYRSVNLCSTEIGQKTLYIIKENWWLEDVQM